jgi:glycosyltransferase involved in cell wall biosynthesis
MVARKAFSPIDYLNAMMLAEEPRAMAGTEERSPSPGAARWQRYFAPVPALSQGLPVPFLGIMVLIWQLRDQDLQALYDLRSEQSRLDFIAWCIACGRLEYRALQQADRFWQALDAPMHFAGANLPEDDPVHAISWKMAFLLRHRSDLNLDLATREGRQALLAWYVFNGRKDHGFASERFQPWQIRYFFSASSLPRLNRLQELVYFSRPDVMQSFPLPTATDGFIVWFRQFITVETGLIEALRSLPDCAPQSGSGPLPFGVNVIGYAYGQLGIGEDARMAMKSILACGLPATMLDFSPGKAVSQLDRSMSEFVGDEPCYGINMFCLSALEHARYFAERGCETLANRINIGYWPWELATWPREWQHLLSLVDEVWVSSPHTSKSVQSSPLAAIVPIRLMPMAVVLDEIAQRDRAAFGLPPKACLFLFAFDLNSSAKRKNPKACVLAFLKAFPLVQKAGQGHQPGRGSQQVGLVIKVHPPAAPNPDWDELKQLQASDPRIHLIEQTLSKPDLLALYRACDCFVSLHRAEGFGRCIAEAMLLARPVITTAYSGNMAFTGPENALLVDYKLKRLAANDYPFGHGQVWAEPDITAAAKLMRQVLEQPATVKPLAAKGKSDIGKAHRPAIIGKRYADALRRLWLAQGRAGGRRAQEK